MTVLATAGDAIGLLFVLLALGAFGVAVWLAAQRAYVAAVVAAVVGLLILVATSY